MQLWLDTADIQTIDNANSTGILYGITTNPSILAASNKPPLNTIQQLLEIQAGPVAAQVTADNVSEIVMQARQFRRLNSRIIVKIPVTVAGLSAISILKKEKIPVMATTIFTAQQVLLSSMANADYVALYLNGMEQIQGNFTDELTIMLNILERQKFTTKIMGAAIKNIQQIVLCATLGVHAITVPPVVFNNLISTFAETTKSLEKFAKDWNRLDKKSLDELFIGS